MKSLVKRMNSERYALVLLMLSAMALMIPSYIGAPTAPPLPSVMIAPNSTTLNVGENQTFIVSAIAPDQNNNPAPVNGLQLDITSSDTTIGTVSPISAVTDSSGNVTVTFKAIKAGSATVTAKNTSALAQTGGSNATSSATVTVRTATTPTPTPTPTTTTAIDMQPPIIGGVNLSNTTPMAGSSITVIANNVTDNVAVTKVTINGTQLINQGNNTWKGTIVAQAGTHNVSVVAFDAVGNNVTFSVNYTATMLDTIPPIINSVMLSNTTPITGSSINVTVNTTDNVGVAQVTANGTVLVNQGGNIWNGSIVAQSGTHNVSIMAFDAAGNNDTDNSTSYTAFTAISTIPILTGFNVIPTTEISDTNPAIASVNVAKGDNNISIIEFGVIDNNNLLEKGANTIIVAELNFSGNQGFYYSNPWPGSYATIENIGAENIGAENIGAENIGTENMGVSDIVSLGRSSETPGFLVRGTFKENSSSNGTEAILVFNETTGNLSHVIGNVSKTHDFATGDLGTGTGKKLKIQDGNSTFRAKIIKMAANGTCTFEYSSTNAFTLYNTTGNLSENNPRIETNNIVPEGNYKVYALATDINNNMTTQWIDIDTIIPTTTSGGGGGGGSSSGGGSTNPQGNGSYFANQTTIPTTTGTTTMTPTTTIETTTTTIPPIEETQTTPIPTTTTPSRKSPGFEIVIAIGAIVAIFILRKNR